MSNVVQLAIRRRPDRPLMPASPVKQASPALGADHLKALGEIQLLCLKALDAGGLGKVQRLDEDFMVALHRAFKHSDWAVRFQRRNGFSQPA